MGLGHESSNPFHFTDEETAWNWRALEPRLALRWGLQRNGFLGARLRMLAWAAGRLGHSLKRVGGATRQSTVQASPKVSGRSFKNLFFLFRGLVHPGHSLSYIVFPLNQ